MPFGRNPIRRRDALAALAGLSLAPKALRAEATEPGPTMLPEYLAARLNATASRWSAEVAALSTAESATARNRFVRAKEHELLGGFPKRTPLNARVIQTAARDGYRIESVMYQSRPDFWITANLYVPTRGTGPYPGIISPCGHYDPGRFHPDYQLAYRHLVENGFVVLAFDPIGQGERRHFWDPQTNSSDRLGRMGRGSGATTEHSLACHHLALLGESVNEYFVWDGMRGVDYLLSRKEVDAKRIGAAGHSGGGTATMYLGCADERIHCVVVHEGGLSHQWPIDPKRGRLEPADGEQNLFGAASYGMDFVELSAAISPRPLLISVEHFNPAFNAAAEDVKKRYALLGLSDRFTTVEANAPHAWTKRLSLATSDWFSRFFYDRPGPSESPDYQPEPEEILRCVPNGSLLHSGYDSVFTRTSKQAAALRPAVPKDLPGALKSMLRYRKIDAPLATVETAPGRVNIASEQGVTLPAIVARATGASKGTIVYLDGEGADAANSAGLLQRIAESGRTVIAVDLRGMGRTKMASTTSRTGTFVQIFDAETWASYSAWQLEDSLVGMRVADTVRAVDYALSLEGGSGVQVVGKGLGALPALMAAAIDPRITGVVCHGGLLSYSVLAASDETLYTANVLVPGMLKSFDLPDIAASIAGRSLRIIDPTDAMKRTVAIPAATEAYRRTSDAYRARGAAGKFRILSASAGGDMVDSYFN